MTLEGLIAKIVGSIPARRGNVYQTTVRKRRPDGTVRENGPYFIWTRCENGKMKSSYVPAPDVPRYRREIERGRRMDVLIGELWKLAEEMAEPGKKTPRRSTGRRPC